MLQCINKYSIREFYVNNRNITYKSRGFVNLTKKTTISINSVFLRKSHFRSLLMYINIQYSNLNDPADHNQFYQPKITTICIANKHPGFLFKKRILK